MNDELQKEKPTYYSILPATVRYDERLSHFSKILYSEICVLANKEGHCFATNAWFSEVLNMSERTITRGLTELSDCNYLSFKNRDGREGRRQIYVNEIKMSWGLDKDDVKTIDKNVEHNSTSINNTSIILQGVSGKSALQRIINFYGLLWRDVYGSFPVGHNYGRLGSAFKPLFVELTEYQLALLLMQYFKWHGASGEDTFLHKRLSENNFPLLWFPSYISGMSAFYKNTLDVDINDEKRVVGLVDKKIKELL